MSLIIIVIIKSRIDSQCLLRHLGMIMTASSGPFGSDAKWYHLVCCGRSVDIHGYNSLLYLWMPRAAGTSAPVGVLGHARDRVAIASFKLTSESRCLVIMFWILGRCVVAVTSGFLVKLYLCIPRIAR